METPFAAYHGDEPYVFVCYAHDDRDVVYEEMVGLREQGVNLWYDEGISAGKNWRAAIGDALLGASRVLFYISESSLSSDHCNREINLALDEGKEVVPVYLETVELTSDLKVGLNRVQALFRSPDTNYRQHLLDALGNPQTLELPPAKRPKPPPLRLQSAYRAAALAVIVAIAMLAVWLATSLQAPDAARKLALIMSGVEPIGSPRISPDGAMLAYIQSGDLFVRRVAGGRPIRLTETQALEGSPSFSPDGELIAFNRFHLESVGAAPDVYVIPTLGGVAVPLVKKAASVSWSYDGQRIVYVTFRDDEIIGLAVANSDGRDVAIIHDRSEDYTLGQPQWSPDGSTIAFVRGIGGASTGIWLIDASGGDLRSLNSAPESVTNDPVFTPDGRSIIHTSSQGGAINIWETPLDGRQPKRLTTGPGPDVAPTVTTAGSVAFLNSKWKRSVLLYDDSSNGVEVHSHVYFLWAPVFSPDGKVIAFSQAEPDGSWHIWLVDTEGTTPRQLTFGDVRHVYPQFTPDGHYVVYLEWSAGSNRVWRVPREGGAPAELTPDGVDASYADVSPDGQWLAYVGAHGDETRIHILSLAGGEPRMLMDQRASLPRWSPDGEQIAFTVDRTWDKGIFLVGLDGENPRQLAERGGFPVWWPDGSKIGYLVHGRDGLQEIHTTELANGLVEKLGIEFHGSNSPFDVHASGQIVTTDNIPLIHEVWLLK